MRIREVSMPRRRFAVFGRPPRVALCCSQTMPQALWPTFFVLVIAFALLGMMTTSLAARGASPWTQDAIIGPLSLHRVTITPTLLNASFECPNGYYTQTNSLSQTIHIPNDWHLVTITGTPVISSARSFFAGSCAGSAHVERMEGIDSIYLRAQDLETNPNPGKPFDVAFYQQTAAITGTAYSLSSWMLSLCGGSAVPSDCPQGYYMAKMIGIDPTGGTDPNAESVVWSENRDNFVSADSSQRIGWSNVHTSVVAQAVMMTVFARVSSPFRWHGNHAFVDALSLARAPTAQFVELPDPTVLTGTVAYTGIVVNGNRLELNWEGEQSPDVAAIPGGSHQLLFDVQYRMQTDEEWHDLAVDQLGNGCTAFVAPAQNEVYEFRLRTRAEQLAGGVRPNHRYPGIWSEPVSAIFTGTVEMPSDPIGQESLFLPVIQAPSGTVVGQPCVMK